MGEDGSVGGAGGSHDGGADLAQAHSVAPAGAFQSYFFKNGAGGGPDCGIYRFIGHDIACGIEIFNIECGAFQMVFRKYTSDFQFLAYHRSLFASCDFQLHDICRRYAHHRN